MGFVARPCQPSTLRMLIWPEASSAQNSMAAVSADGSTVCVLILRLNSSCSRSIAFVVRAEWVISLRGWPATSPSIRMWVPTREFSHGFVRRPGSIEQLVV